MFSCLVTLVMNFENLLPLGGNDTNVWNVQYDLSDEKAHGFNNGWLNQRWLNQRLLEELNPLSQNFAVPKRSASSSVEDDISDTTIFTIQGIKKRYKDPLFRNLIEEMVP